MVSVIPTLRNVKADTPTRLTDLEVSRLKITGAFVSAQGMTQSPTVMTGDGAVPVVSSTVAITKGSAAALTIVAPTVAQDGTLIRIYTETAFAHILTCSTNGFNEKGSSGTVTLTAAKGNGFLLHARNGVWWVIQILGATVA